MRSNIIIFISYGPPDSKPFVATFPPHSAGCLAQVAYLRLCSISCLGNNRRLHVGWVHVFPRLARVTCFPALGTVYKFSRACDRLHATQVRRFSVFCQI